jgi:hypothetical protein
MWAFVLHRGRPDLHAGVLEFYQYDPSFRDLRVGEIASERRSARWELTFESQAAPFAYTGRLVERFLPTGNAMAHPRLAVTGTVEFDGRRYTFSQAPGGRRSRPHVGIVACAEVELGSRRLSPRLGNWCVDPPRVALWPGTRRAPAIAHRNCGCSGERRSSVEPMGGRRNRGYSRSR